MYNKYKNVYKYILIFNYYALLQINYTKIKNYINYNPIINFDNKNNISFISENDLDSKIN